MHHLHGVVNLRNTVNIEAVLLIGYHIVDVIVLSTEKLQDLRIDTECLDCFRRIVDS